MTRTLTLVAGIAFAAVAIAPAAVGASGPHRGATATLPLASTPTYTTTPSRPAILAATRTHAEAVHPLREARVALGHPPPYRASTSADTTLDTPRVASDRGIEWSQIGIGVAIGMALAIVLALALHAVRARPITH